MCTLWGGHFWVFTCYSREGLSTERMPGSVERNQEGKEKQKHSSLVSPETQASLPIVDSESLPSLCKTFLFLISGSYFGHLHLK